MSLCLYLLFCLVSQSLYFETFTIFAKVLCKKVVLTYLKCINKPELNNFWPSLIVHKSSLQFKFLFTTFFHDSHASNDWTHSSVCCCPCLSLSGLTWTCLVFHLYPLSLLASVRTVCPLESPPHTWKLPLY